MYNVTTVQFVTGDIGGGVVESDNVTLTIQGITCDNEKRDA